MATKWWKPAPDFLGRHHWMKFWAVAIPLALCNHFFLANLWVMQYPGILLMDGVDAATPKPTAQHTVLVTITPDEYRTEFGRISPLKPDRLGTAVRNLLKLSPKLLAVDLDTSDERFRTLAREFRNSGVIWARGLTREAGATVPGGFLGNPSDENALAGIAAFKRDPDWSLRKLDACIKVGDATMRTFHRAIFVAAEKVSGPVCEMYRIPLTPYRFQTLTLTEAENAHANLSNKIVILGGTYDDRDIHPTRGGSEVYGVEIVGSAVESQYAAADEPGWKAKVERWAEWPVEFALGAAIFAIYAYGKRISGTVKLALSLLLCAFILFVPGVLLYRYGVWLANPFPMVFGMMLHGMYEAAED